MWAILKFVEVEQFVPSGFLASKAKEVNKVKNGKINKGKKEDM